MEDAVGIRSKRNVSDQQGQNSRAEIIVMIMLLLATLVLAFPMG